MYVRFENFISILGQMTGNLGNLPLDIPTVHKNYLLPYIDFRMVMISSLTTELTPWNVEHEVQYRIHKSSPIIHIQSQTKPMPCNDTHFFKI